MYVLKQSMFLMHISCDLQIKFLVNELFEKQYNLRLLVEDKRKTCTDVCYYLLLHPYCSLTPNFIHRNSIYFNFSTSPKNMSIQIYIHSLIFIEIFNIVIMTNLIIIIF